MDIETLSRPLRTLMGAERAVPVDEVRGRVDGYVALHDAEDASGRKAQASQLARTYYDLVTDFYEHGWGRSFHFAPLATGESLPNAIVRHQHYLAAQLQLRPGMRVLDLGCGVGGPLRAIARFSGAEVVGLNINTYQIARARRHTEVEGPKGLCSFVEGDFTAMPFAAGELDAAYVVEATCHAAERRDVFREVHRVLRPGALFAGYEWCLTDRYQDQNPAHHAARRGIEKGNSLPELVTTAEIGRALADSGFEVLSTEDRALAATADPATPWYSPLAAGMSLNGFMHTRAGTQLTHTIVQALEWARLSPRGTTSVHDVLRIAQRSLVAGGRLGVFTPMFFFLARKRDAAAPRASG